MYVDGLGELGSRLTCEESQDEEIVCSVAVSLPLEVRQWEAEVYSRVSHGSFYRRPYFPLNNSTTSSSKARSKRGIL